MTSRDLLVQQISELSDADAAVVLVLVHRLRARAQPPVSAPGPAPHVDPSRPNTAPLAGSVRFLGDVESPLDERWDADT